MRRDTLIDFFDDLAAARGEFLVYDDGFRTRTIQLRRGRPGGARVRRRGCTPRDRQGDKVVFWGENRPEWIVAFWGCLLRGVIVVPIDYRSSPDFLARVARDRVGEDSCSSARTCRRSPTPPAARDVAARTSCRGTAAPPADRRRRSTIARDDIAQIIFTSGATAEPKGVVIRHRNVLANIVPVEREVLKYRKYARPFLPLRFLNLLPLSHMFGQSMATIIPPMLPRHRRLHAQLQPARHRPRDQEPADLGAGVRAEDPRRAARARRGGSAGGGRAGRRRACSIPDRQRWWRYRRVHRAFGLKFWAFVVGAAPLDAELEEFWGARVRRHPGLRPHRDRADRHAEPSVQDQARDRSASRSPASR